MAPKKHPRVTSPIKLLENSIMTDEEIEDVQHQVFNLDIQIKKIIETMLRKFELSQIQESIK